MTAPNKISTNIKDNIYRIASENNNGKLQKAINESNWEWKVAEVLSTDKTTPSILPEIFRNQFPHWQETLETAEKYYAMLQNEPEALEHIFSSIFIGINHPLESKDIVKTARALNQDIVQKVLQSHSGTEQLETCACAIGFRAQNGEKQVVAETSHMLLCYAGKSLEKVVSVFEETTEFTGDSYDNIILSRAYRNPAVQSLVSLFEKKKRKLEEPLRAISRLTKCIRPYENKIIKAVAESLTKTEKIDLESVCHMIEKIGEITERNTKIYNIFNIYNNFPQVQRYILRFFRNVAPQGSVNKINPLASEKLEDLIRMLRTPEVQELKNVYKESSIPHRTLIYYSLPNNFSEENLILKTKRIAQALLNKDLQERVKEINNDSELNYINSFGESLNMKIMGRIVSQCEGHMPYIIEMAKYINTNNPELREKLSNYLGNNNSDHFDRKPKQKAEQIIIEMRKYQ